MARAVVMDLSEFLLARIGEDEAVARSLWDWMTLRHGPDFWTTDEGAPFDGEWRYETDRDASLHASPRRVLAECEAKRRIVKLARTSVTEIAWTAIGCSETTEPGDTEAPEKILRALALPYADHSDYQQEWKV